jgi:two-component system phosphate regulon sensor histidine kinase PhoR
MAPRTSTVPWAAPRAGDGAATGGPHRAATARAARSSGRARTIDDGPAPSDQVHVLVRQLPFAAVVVLMALLLPVIAVEPDTGLAFTAAIVAVAATGAAVAVPWERLPRSWSAVVPLLDIVVAGLLQLAGVPATIALVLPVLWLSTVFGAAGVATALGGSLLALVPSVVLLPEGGSAGAARVLLQMSVLTATGAYILLAERRSAARRELLRQQGAVLEEILAESRTEHRLLETILDTIDVGVVAVDPDGTISLLNRAHADATGGRLKVGDHVTRHAGVGGFEADRRTPLGTDGSPLVRAWRGESVSRVLTWWRDGDLDWVAYRVSVSPFTDDDGRHAGAVVVYQDFTAELAAMAEREDFVSAVSHELRTPLTSILGYLELVVDDPGLDPSTRDQLRVVERNAERLQRLIDDLLTARRTRHGELRVERSATDLAGVVRDSVASQRPRAVATGVSVVADVEGSAVVDGDRARLGQVVDNLLSNAIKYSRPGGSVTLRLERDGDAVRLVVADDGIGIAQADLGRLFDRFFRAEAVRHGPVQGTGLGLHVSRQIVEAHGGSIAVASEPGVGTRVTVLIPALAADAGGSALAAPGPASGPDLGPEPVTGPARGPAPTPECP